MSTYHKIKTVWNRDPANDYRTLIRGDWAKPEFAYLADAEWAATEKIHGTNIRIIWDGESVTFGGRTDRAQIPAHLVNALVELFPEERCREAFIGPITLYGEGYGAKIQKGGGRYRSDPSFILFDALAGDTWLERSTLDEIAVTLGIDMVPELFRGTLHDAIAYVRDGAEPSYVATDPEYVMEGLVLRPTVELRNRLGERVITKIKVKDFEG